MTFDSGVYAGTQLFAGHADHGRSLPPLEENAEGKAQKWKRPLGSHSSDTALCGEPLSGNSTPIVKPPDMSPPLLAGSSLYSEH